MNYPYIVTFDDETTQHWIYSPEIGSKHYISHTWKTVISVSN